MVLIYPNKYQQRHEYQQFIYIYAGVIMQMIYPEKLCN
eukprot:SAG31_NODE_7238_length_1747_cov_1.879248_1_plen_37_part_10